MHTAWSGLAAAIVSGVVLFVAPASAATFTPIDLPDLNLDIRGYTNGGSYSVILPLAGTSAIRTFNGVPFSLASLVGGNNIYNDPFTNGTLTLSPNIFGASTVYTLMNSAFGVLGKQNATLEFTGSGGATYSVPIVQGSNIRDHFNGSFNNTIDNVSAVAAFQGAEDVRLDMQIFNLPVAFQTQTLTSIRFVGTQIDNPPADGVPFLAAATIATVSAVPEPQAYLMLAFGLLGVAAAVRRRSARASRR